MRRGKFVVEKYQENTKLLLGLFCYSFILFICFAIKFIFNMCNIFYSFAISNIYFIFMKLNKSMY